MAVFTVSLQQASGVGDVSLGDGTTLATLDVSAGRGPKGDGFTGGTYDAGTGKVTFTSNDGIGFSTDDLRGDLTEPGPIGSVTPNTGAFTSLSTTGNAVIGGDLTVEGTTTTVDSTTVAVGDKNIELAKDATTPAEADGGGITLTGASATITYSSANDYWALNKGLNVSGDVSLSGTVDGRDVAADGSKLDGIESGATADQTAGEIKTAYESNADTNAFTDAEQSKLAGIESGADVTDTANVTAAGALMDSELTSEASVKALDQGVATTDSPDFAGLSVDTDTLYVDSANNRVGIGKSSPDAILAVDGGLVDYTSSATGTGLFHVNGGASSIYTAYIGVADDGVRFGHNGSSRALIFDVNETEAMRINSSGNVGIGTSSPLAPLDVRGNIRADQFIPFGDSESAPGLCVASEIDTGFFRPGGNAIGVSTGGSEAMRIDSGGNVGIGTSSPKGPLDVDGNIYYDGSLLPSSTASNGSASSPTIPVGFDYDTGFFRADTNTIGITTGGSEAMRIDSSGNVLVGTTDELVYVSSTNTGVSLRGDIGFIGVSRDGGAACQINRLQDGALQNFASAGTTEGSISVSGTTVSYNGGHLSRWSRLPDDTDDTHIYKGTVMTNLDEMCEWRDEEGDLEDNEQLNKTTVSSEEGDPNVAGLFVAWDEDDDWGDYYLAMTGDLVIRIAQGVTVQRGDLLMSAGDGTAKPQGDDIVRSKTVAKVTSTNISHTYPDGSYAVPCVVMAC